VTPLLLALALQVGPAGTPMPNQAPAPAPPPRAAPAPALPERPAAPALPAGPPVPAAVAERYRACVDLVRANPEQATEAASAWRVEGGGIYARQCLGLAYVALERWSPAATVYEQAAADAAQANDPRRADFLVQAGNAWLAAGEPTRAVLALDAALATANLSEALRGEVYLDRARAMVALNNAAAARQDIDRATSLVAADPMAWYLSAELARREGNLARANTDIQRALGLAQDNPDITLLAGTIAGQNGDMVRAEALYRRVADGAPSTDAGRAARASLDTLREVEVDAPAATPGAPTPPSTPPRL